MYFSRSPVKGRPLLQHFSFCTFIPPDCGQYMWPKRVAENKIPTYTVFVPYLLVITRHVFNFNIILHPPNVDDMNKWRYTSSPPKCFRVVNRDNFRFTFTPATLFYIHLTSMIWISGGIPLLPLNAFVVWTGTILVSPYACTSEIVRCCQVFQFKR